MNKLQKTLGSVAVASILALTPVLASADSLNVSSSAGVVISPNGIVRVIGADVTAVGNGVVDAVTHIGNVVLNWVVNVSASTKVAANGSKDATTTDIAVGDKIAFKGTLSSSTGSLLTVDASKVRDITNFPFPRIAMGTVSSLNTTNNSFVVTNGSTTTTVFTNASTSISVDGTSTTLASIPVGSKVAVVGSKNSDGSILATKVIVRTAQNDKNKDEGKNDNDNDGDHGEKAVLNANANAKAHADEHSRLNFLGGFHLGLGKDN